MRKNGSLEGSEGDKKQKQCPAPQFTGAFCIILFNKNTKVYIL